MSRALRRDGEVARRRSGWAPTLRAERPRAAWVNYYGAVRDILSTVVDHIAPPVTRAGSWWVLVVALVIGACSDARVAERGLPIDSDSLASRSFYATQFERQPSSGELTLLGRALFFDSTLSASGRMACATCHDPAYAWSGRDARPVQFGGQALTSPGLRAVPSLTYQQDVAPFTQHFYGGEREDGADQGPAGGHDWDGRASSLHAQAIAPLLSPFEMGNLDRAKLVSRLRRSPNAPLFRIAFGAHVLGHSALAWNGVLAALEAFQQSPRDFYPYTSKYDAYLRGQTDLTSRELRGLRVFNDPVRGNCAQCHPSAAAHGALPQFTDRGFVALGVPRNPAISANADIRYFDLGLCGPLRADLTSRRDFCGMFRTPSLRNVARRRVFFHNGLYTDLRDVLRFYAQRDLHPSLFYPRERDGTVRKFDDLPVELRPNVSFVTPFGRRSDGKPAFTESEADDLIAFLSTLTDGYPSRRERVKH